MKKILITAIFYTLLYTAQTYAIAPGMVRFNNEASDTTIITKILIDVEANGQLTPGETVVAIAENLIGTPYKAGTLEGENELLTVSMDGMDCTTFIENVLAMAMTIEGHRSSWRDFIYNLEQIRYRGGQMNGYASRLHYFSDWIVDNSHSGHLKEVTSLVGNADYQVKTLDFMTRNREKYEALTNDENFSGLKNAEIGYRSHRYAYIKPNNIAKAELKNGDIVAFTTSINGLDVTHVGLLKIVNGVPHLIHASSKTGKVVLDPLPLEAYVKRLRSTGIRVARLAE